MGTQNMPAAEVSIGAETVRALLDDQHPDLASLPISFLSEGWDNVMFRLGDSLIVRLPRRRASVALIEHEQRWLPELASMLPLPIPAAVRTGGPGGAYPWPWSIVAWVDGARAAEATLRDPLAEARRLGGFLRALHRPAPADAPPNEVRGVPLADRATITDDRFATLRSLIDEATLRPIWDAGLEAPPWTDPPVWLHGDLHAANLIVAGGRIASVIDWGDITSGDPATDLAVAWMLFDGPARIEFRISIGADDAMWARARAWAVTLGLAYLAHSADNPAMAQIGRRTLRAVTGDIGHHR